MATKRPSQLPAIGSVQPTDPLVVEDGGGMVRKATVSQLQFGRLPISEAGNYTITVERTA